MNSINLMPKVPFTARYFIMLALLIVLSIGGAGAGLYWYNGQLQANAERQKAEGSESQKQLQTLVSETKIDPLVKEISGLMTEFTKLKESRRDWIPVFRAIAAEMPQASRMTQVSEQGEHMAMTVQFVSLDDAAHYVLRLGQNTLFEEVTLQRVAAKSSGNATGAAAGLYEAQIDIKLMPVHK